MGRIISSVQIDNVLEPKYNFRFDAMVDTGASHLVLPTAWKNRLGTLHTLEKIQVEIATQEAVDAEVCGPVRIQLEGFRPIYSEVLFVDMKPEDGVYEPLIGYIVLEQSAAAVDMVGHRLVHVKHLDLK